MGNLRLDSLPHLESGHRLSSDTAPMTMCVVMGAFCFDGRHHGHAVEGVEEITVEGLGVEDHHAHADQGLD